MVRARPAREQTPRRARRPLTPPPCPVDVDVPLGNVLRDALALGHGYGVALVVRLRHFFTIALAVAEHVCVCVGDARVRVEHADGVGLADDDREHVAVALGVALAVDDGIAERHADADLLYDVDGYGIGLADVDWQRDGLAVDCDAERERDSVRHDDSERLDDGVGDGVYFALEFNERVLVCLGHVVGVHQCHADPNGDRDGVVEHVGVAKPADCEHEPDDDGDACTERADEPGDAVEHGEHVRDGLAECLAVALALDERHALVVQLRDVDGEHVRVDDAVNEQLADADFFDKHERLALSVVLPLRQRVLDTVALGLRHGLGVADGVVQHERLNDADGHRLAVWLELGLADAQLHRLVARHADQDGRVGLGLDLTHAKHDGLRHNDADGKRLVVNVRHALGVQLGQHDGLAQRYRLAQHEWLAVRHRLGHGNRVQLADDELERQPEHEPQPVDERVDDALAVGVGRGERHHERIHERLAARHAHGHVAVRLGRADALGLVSRLG